MSMKHYLLAAGAERGERSELYFTARQLLDRDRQLILRTPERDDAIIAHYRQRSVSPSKASPSNVSNALMAVVRFTPMAAANFWFSGKHTIVPTAPIGALNIFDLRQSLIAELLEPFETVNFIIPNWMFKELAAEHGVQNFDL